MAGHMRRHLAVAGRTDASRRCRQVAARLAAAGAGQRPQHRRLAGPPADPRGVATRRLQQADRRVQGQYGDWGGLHNDAGKRSRFVGGRMRGNLEEESARVI